MSENTPDRSISPTNTSATLSARSRNILPSLVERNKGIVAVGPTSRQSPAMRSSPMGIWRRNSIAIIAVSWCRGIMLSFLLWCILLIFCWPLAIVALILYPLVWLLLLPFRILGIAVGGVLELVKAIIVLPARILRGPSRSF